MKISYYPGCTLKNTAKNYEDSAIAALEAFGIELDEIEHWNCCGTVFSLAADNVMYHLAPIRNLVRTREAGSDKLLTLCSMCFNALKRANKLFREDEEKREKIKRIMDKEEIKYDGKAEVVHVLEVLRDDIGFNKIKEKIGGSLEGLKLAPYYGCMLVRPEGIGVDDMENPTVFEDLINLTGAEAVYFPHKTDCCGAYQTVTWPAVVADRTNTIVSSARKSGADALVVSCPLCAFNLDQRQKATKEAYPEFTEMPVLYITEFLWLALGNELKDEWKELHYVSVDGMKK